MIRGAVAVALALALPARAAGPAGHTERVEYHDPATPPSRGPANAPVTIEIFFVPGIATPSQAMRLLQQLADRHPARVRLVYRVIKTGASMLTPAAALEAHAEGKFFELIDELGRMRAGLLKREELAELARRLGLDPQRVSRASQVASYRDTLEANQRRLDRLHISAAPTAIVFNARATKLMLGNASAHDIDTEYNAAYQRALDKLDRGYAPDRLMQAFEEDAMLQAPPAPPPPLGEPDDDDGPGTTTPLASPPLQLDGLPALGKPGARVPVVVLCRPSDQTCGNLIRVVEPLVRTYPDDVRVVWAPWFDVTKPDGGGLEQAMLGDAALCAESIGSNQGELTASPGWLWSREMQSQISSGRVRGRKLDPVQLIDATAAKLDVSGPALAACRARMAGASVDWVSAARRAGVPVGRAHPGAAVMVIGGRIYQGPFEPAVMQGLVEAELAPGVLGSLPHWPR